MLLVVALSIRGNVSPYYKVEPGTLGLVDLPDPDELSLL